MEIGIATHIISICRINPMLVILIEVGKVIQLEKEANF
jgi:hypothetical protein